MMRMIAAMLLISGITHAQARADYPGRVPKPRRAIPQSSTITPTIGGYGDSIMVGFCNSMSPIEKLASTLPGYASSNMAQAGTTTAQIKDRYFATRDTACSGERCGTYVFQGGVNNCHSLNSCVPATMISDMFNAIDNARGLRPRRRVIAINIAPFVGCAPCTGPTVTGWGLAKQYNALWASACVARPDLACVDVGGGSQWEQTPTDGTLRTAWSCDGIHWLQAGADALAVEMRKAF